jgi:class 3 adenylate cyclase
MEKENNHLIKFVNELFFRSGAFSVYYLSMDIFQSGVLFLKNDGHLIFGIVTLAQSWIVTTRKLQGATRFLAVLVAPLTYTLVESFEGWDFVFNSAHVFIWIFAIMTALIIFLEEKYRSNTLEKFFSGILISINVTAFMAAYFYAEMKIGFSEYGLSAIDASSLRFDMLLNAFPQFITDPSHIYLLFGSVVMAFALIIEKNFLLDLKNRIKDIFGSYIDESLSERIIDGSAPISERATIAVLFADIRGFTTLSENRDAEEIMKMLNLYYQYWFDISKKHQGIIDKYIGDGIMIWWKLDDGEGATQATQCALEMLQEIPLISSSMEKQGLPVLRKIGIGIAAGEAIVGNVGHSKRRDFTCIGDTVNTASRLESLSKDLGTDLIIGKSVYDLLPTTLKDNFSDPQTAPVKGRVQEVEIYLHKP